MKEACIWANSSKEFNSEMPSRADVVVIGGDLPALLLGSRLAQAGRFVVVLADEIGGGAFGRGHGIISPHYNVDLQGIEDVCGGESAKSFLDLRQYVVDELARDYNLAQICGHTLSHDVHSTLKMRKEHDALQRHGAARTWHSSHCSDVHQSVRERSSHNGDLSCNPIELLHAIADRIRDLGGVVRNRVRSLKLNSCGNSVQVNVDGGICGADRVYRLDEKGPFRETIFASDTGLACGRNEWYRNSFPMFDYVRKMHDGRIIGGSRRTWRVGGDGLTSNVHNLCQHLISDRQFVPTHSWARPFTVYEKETLPSFRQNGRVIETFGAGQDDSVMDLIVVDELVRAQTGEDESAFSKALSSLPRADFKSGPLTHIAFQAMLDSKLASDSKMRRI
jgi:hypothetical protein